MIAEERLVRGTRVRLIALPYDVLPTTCEECYALLTREEYFGRISSGPSHNGSRNGPRWFVEIENHRGMHGASWWFSAAEMDDPDIVAEGHLAAVLRALGGA